MAVIVNRRCLVRPSVFLGLISLLVIEAFINSLQARHFGTIYRSFRLGGFVFALWLLSPWWGRRDLLLVRSHVITMTVVLSFTILGLIVSPSQALGGGRLGGAFWPTPPPQVAEFAAVTLGLVVVMWLAARFSGWGTLFVTCIAVLILYLSHTRTAILALMLGIFVAGLSMISTEARVRKLFVSIGIVATFVAVTLSGVVTTWLLRGQGTQQLTSLTGRTATWLAVVSIPRDLFQVIFGFGLSNKSANGLPVDSNWLASFLDQGVFGVVVSAAASAVRAGDRVLPAARGEAFPGPVPRHLLPGGLVHRDRFQRRVHVPARADPGGLAPGDVRCEQETGMKIVLVHNRYRSAAPSGENRVVDQEGQALRDRGHEVIPFERHSDEIEQWPAARRAALPARVIWSREARRALTATLREHQPDVVHVHNTFPAAERGYLVRLPGHVGSGRHDHPQLQARLRQRRLLPAGSRLPRLRPRLALARAVGTGATGARGSPPLPWPWP